MNALAQVRHVRDVALTPQARGRHVAATNAAGLKPRYKGLVTNLG
jgi:hypothetical protein